MVTSLSKHVDDLMEEIRKIKCNNFSCFLKYGSVKDNLIKHKCLSFNKEYC